MSVCARCVACEAPKKRRADAIDYFLENEAREARAVSIALKDDSEA